MKLSTKLKISAGALALAAITATSAQALTDTFTVDVTFTEPFTITETTPGSLGELVTTNGSYTQNATTGVVTPTTPGAGVVAAGAAAVITLTETGAGTADVDITVDNQQAGVNGFMTIDGFNCSYGGATATGASCVYDAEANPTGVGTALNIGFNVTVANSPVDADTDQADYDVTIVFD
jgi:hypothetical protein